MGIFRDPIDATTNSLEASRLNKMVHERLAVACLECVLEGKNALAVGCSLKES